MNETKLSKEQQKYLRNYVNKGAHSSRSILRTRSLLLLWDGMTQSQIALTVGCCIATITNLLARFHYCVHKGNVHKVLAERPAQDSRLSLQVEAHITALAC